MSLTALYLVCMILGQTANSVAFSHLTAENIPETDSGFAIKIDMSDIDSDE